MLISLRTVEFVLFISFFAMDLYFYIITGGKVPQKLIDSNSRAKGLLEDYGSVGHTELFPDVGCAFPGDSKTELGKAIDFIISK